MKRYGLLRVALLVVILTACTAFSVYAEKVEIEVESMFAVGHIKIYPGNIQSGVHGPKNGWYVPSSYHYHVFDDDDTTYVLLVNAGTYIDYSLSTDVFNISNGLTFYLTGSNLSYSTYPNSFFIRIDFSDGSSRDFLVDVTENLYNYPYYIDFDHGDVSITGLYFEALHYFSGYTPRLIDIQIYVNDPLPPEPADPPSPPIYGGSMSSFEVTAKNSGDGNISFYYEDIVNAFYLSAIDAGAMSYAEYPYTTVMSFLEGGYTCWYLIATDKPFYSNLYLDESNPDWIATADFPQGVSGVVFALSVPAGSLIAGEDYVFKSMTSFSNIGPFDFASYIRDGLPMPLDNGEFVVLDSLASLVMSFESQKVGRYAICSNYALTPQSHITFGDYYPIKQSFKFAETWAQLLRLSSGDDQSAILRQIMESLRSTDLSVTVYERIEQIYNLMNDTSTLSPNDPIQSQIDKSVEALNEWSDSIEDPELNQVLTVTTQISSSLDKIMLSLGALGILTTIGLILGVIKVALQR